MIRKVQTRSGTRQHFYHQTEGNNNCQLFSNDIIRPPSSHPYSGYRSKKSQQQMRSKYCPNFFLESKLDTNLRELKSAFQPCQFIQKLPHPFKLAINQFRIIAKNTLHNKNKEIDDLIQNLAKSIVDLIEQKNDLLKIREENVKNIEALSAKIIQLEKKSNSMDCGIECKKYNKRNDQKIEQEILLENCKLGQLNSKYLTRISQLENQKVEKSVVVPSFKENESKADTQLLRCHNRISYLQMKLTTAEKVEQQLNLLNEKLNVELTTTKLKLQDYSQQYQQIFQKANEWRQRAIMQREDGEIHISRQQFLLYSLKKLKQNNKNLLNKFLTVYKSDEKIQKKDLLQSPNFEYEMDIFKSISSVYHKNKGQKPFTHEQVQKSELGLETEEVSLETDYKNYKKSDSFDVSGLRYYRPSFFSFIEETANPEIVHSRNKSSSSVSRVFIQILRAIMASKLNQFMLTQCPQKYTRFPEFAFAWFERFYFNTEKNSICALQPFMQKPINQQLFYRDLMNVKLDQSWEIITFREFILEELSLEELYFYLMCQMLLYSKAGITRQIQYLGDFSILVEYTAAKTVIDITLNDFESWNITFLTSKLRQKIIVRKNKEYIESGFFLRCLLQYYRIQRSNRYRYISKLCSEFKDSKKGLRFSSFMSVINKFTEISTETKLKLYRDCYCLTKGVITPESIFIVCSEEMIFLKHLKIKSFYRMPKIIQRPTKLTTNAQNHQSNSQKTAKNKQLICLHPPDPYLYDIIIEFSKILTQENSIGKRIEGLGVSEFNQQIHSLARALDERNSEIGSNALKCKHFLHYFLNALEIVRRVTYYNFYEMLEEQTKRKSSNFWIQVNDQDMGETFAQQIKATFATYHRIDDLRKWKDKVYQFRLNHAAKKIQKQVKKKFIEPYLQIYNYFCHQVKAVKQEQKQNKDDKK